MMENNSSCLKRGCYTCSSAEHFTKECPWMHFTPDKEKVIKQYDFTHPQVRDAQYSRRAKRSHNARKIQKTLSDIYKINMEENEEEREDWKTPENVENYNGKNTKGPNQEAGSFNNFAQIEDIKNNEGEFFMMKMFLLRKYFISLIWCKLIYYLFFFKIKYKFSN